MLKRGDEILDDGWAAIVEGSNCTESFHVLEILGGSSGVYLVARGRRELNRIATNTR